MSLRISYTDTPGLTREYSVRREADWLFYDQTDGVFRASPALPRAALPAGTGNYTGVYAAILASTPLAQFSSPDYTVFIHDGATHLAIDSLSALMHDAGSGQADDATVIPTGGGAAPPTVQQIAAQLLDTETVAGLAVRVALRAILADAIGGLTEPADHSTTTITDPGTDPGTATVRITSVNSPTSRVVTLH